MLQARVLVEGCHGSEGRRDSRILKESFYKVHVCGPDLDFFFVLHSEHHIGVPHTFARSLHSLIIIAHLQLQTMSIPNLQSQSQPISNLQPPF
jgi:hypothetical protein